MTAIKVRAFAEHDVSAAAALLAARQKRDRTRCSMLEPSLADPQACLALVQSLRSGRHADAVVAEIDGQVVGFLVGQRMMFAPTEFVSQFVAPHSISIPVQGHAAEPGDALFPLYRAMYAELAARWVRSGFFQHQVNIFAGDADLQEAWVALGFGRAMTTAMRPIGDAVVTHGGRGLDIRRATDEDLDVVVGLGDTLFRFHSLSPMFRPFLDAPQPAAREYHRTMLQADENGYFLGYDGDAPVAMQTYMRHGFLPAIVPQVRNTYLFEGVVAAEARGAGLGSRMLAEGLAWAQARGDEYCTLHFASANPSGAPFWLGHGFVPVEYAMTRHIDERVAWANGWAS